MLSGCLYFGGTVKGPEGWGIEDDNGSCESRVRGAAVIRRSSVSSFPTTGRLSSNLETEKGSNGTKI